ncbi:FecR family protein [Pseudoflavitalea rhizosphaerae]|uniref:FecR family protein n=1 Tax=Pseudoflavitalea rhizosphaerae TaxID=1884793 RepID=UPI000F8D3410|nr:FecR family protein [Pseudoflavitalea rhizosphaerae]
MKQLPEDIIRKYLDGRCTEEEKALVESWHLKDLSGSHHLPSEDAVQQAHDAGRMALAEHIAATRARKPVRRLWPAVAATAAAVLLIYAGVRFYAFFRQDEQVKPATAKEQQLIPAGRDGAVLTLADGSELLLDSVGNGFITTQNGSSLSLQEGQLKYEKGTADNEKISFNTISTPRGRQFKIVLPDGSKAWLNAASALRYPTSFNGPSREVTVFGEVYLEVAKDPSRPFVVTTTNNAMKVEVLGTSFNVNAYEDEPALSTTLLEGSVKVSSGTVSSSVVLQPGQQSQLKAGMPVRTVPVDVNQVVAWKNGVFNFQDASLARIMRQLSRWYDIEVVYEKGIPDLVFEGEVNRDNSLQEVMKSLEGLGVKYRLENNRLVILQ